VLFSLARGLMRVLGAIVEIPRLTMFHSRKHLTLGRFVALQCIGHEEFAKGGGARALVGPWVTLAVTQIVQCIEKIDGHQK
jgi:hypothetical protein